MDNFQSQNSLDKLFNCVFGCENATQCEFLDFIEPSNQLQQQQQQPEPLPPQQQSFPINDNNTNLTQCINNYDDGVVPSNLYKNGSYQQQYSIQNNYSAVNNNLYGANVSQNAQYSGNNENYYYMEQSYTPCRGPRPWNFAECFGFYGDAPCQYANVAVDMEDFM